MFDLLESSKCKVEVSVYAAYRAVINLEISKCNFAEKEVNVS